MNSFDKYEITGILVPGVIMLFGLSRLFPEVVGFVTDKDISVGELGLFVVLAFAAGHLIQALGNVVELVFWKIRGGRPTDWVRSGERSVISAEQKPALQERLTILYPSIESKSIADRSERDWLSLTKQIYAIVQAAGRSRRVDVFNGNYGMFRGIAAALVVCFFAALFSENSSYGLSVILVVLFALALYRMNRFAEHYARELFVQFITISTTKLQKGDA